MPPKKDKEDKPKPLIGRFGTQLKIGIVGLPNVGKSTFFNVLTKSEVPAENYPFCTIDPNESRVPVPDERFDYLVDFFKPDSQVPAFLQIVDIAGLVAGAHSGQGLGNAFLSHIKSCDGIFHMLRAFNDEDVTHVDGEVNPVKDMNIIMEELRLKDLEYVSGQMGKMKSTARSGDKNKLFEYETFCKIEKILDEDKKHVRFGAEWDAKEIEVLNQHLLITSKPMIYLVNMNPDDYIKKHSKWLPKIAEWVSQNDSGALVVPYSAAFENRLVSMSEAEKTVFLETNKTQSALPKIIRAGFNALQLQYFFTAGKDEVKAWTIQKGTKAPQAAGKIHTDFEKGFIMAEVMKFDDFKEHKSENAVKAAGKYRQEGKNYVVLDGDIILFKFNAGGGLAGKKK